MEIIFDSPKTIVITPEVVGTFDSIDITSIIDISDSKLIIATTKDGNSITLWQGEEYDAIGQWTDTDVVNRINELYQ